MENDARTREKEFEQLATLEDLASKMQNDYEARIKEIQDRIGDAENGEQKAVEEATQLREAAHENELDK